MTVTMGFIGFGKARIATICHILQLETTCVSNVFLI